MKGVVVAGLLVVLATHRPFRAEAPEDAVARAKQALSSTLALRDSGPATAEAHETDRRARARSRQAAVERHLALMREVAETFDAVPADAWLPEDRDLVRRALFAQAESFMHDEPQRALAAVDRLLPLPLEDQERRFLREGLLPDILARLDDADRAGRRLELLAHQGRGRDASAFLVALADVRALRDDVGGAREAARRAADEAAREHAADPDDGMAAFREGQARTRAELLGTRLPPTLSLVDGGVLSARGAVRIVDFSATWCMPCLGSVLALDDAHDELVGLGVEVDILLVQADHGWMPDERHRMSSGEVIEVLAPEAHAAHARAYANALRLRTRVRTVTSETAQAHHATSFPLTLVLDASGQVIFVSRGSAGADVVLRAARGAVSSRRSRPHAWQPRGTGG